MSYMILVALTTLSSITLLAQPAPTDSCNEMSKQHPIYQALNACMNARVATLQSEIAENTARIESNGYCALFLETDENISKTICADPNQFVCNRKNGLIFNRKCEFLHLNSNDIQHTPDYIQSRCLLQKAINTIIAKHQNECAPGMSAPDCAFVLQMTYKDEILKTERDLVYTPEKMKRITNAFKQIKTKYIEKIRETKLVPLKYKKLLMDDVMSVKLDLPPNTKTLCANSGPAGPDSALYYSTLTNSIHVCIGAMSALDSQNELDLLYSLGHELSHAIDPCILSVRHQDPLNIWQKTYPNLIPCIRGGTGPEGCKDSVLNCNTEKGIQESCEYEISFQKNLNQEEQKYHMKYCIDKTKGRSTCPASKPDTMTESLDSSDYRKNGEPRSQVDEAFADYFSSEIIADFIHDYSKNKTWSKQDILDGFVALSTDVAGLHGRCLNQNTKDEHPPGYLRLNRIIMGSKKFRTAVGCKTTTEKAMKCQGL